MRSCFIVVLCLLMTGCSVFKGDESYFRNRAKDYRGAFLINPLKMPANVKAPQQSDMYPVPENVSYGDTTVSLEPPYFSEGES
jgi:uncharacterized lipoprotein